MIRFLSVGMVVVMAGAFAPSLALAQKTTTTTKSATTTAETEDPNDKMEHERTFEETRKHMQLHSDWSKKSGKMSDN